MDLSILISTIITSTAALVAIIGGFLVSRVITLFGEKNAITRRLREIDNELTAKSKRLKEIETILLEEDVDDFILGHAREILLGGNKTIKEIIEEDELDFTEDELKPHIEELWRIFHYLVKEIEVLDEDYRLPKDFDQFSRDTDVKVDGTRSWFRQVYRIILSIVRKKSRSILYPGLDLHLEAFMEPPHSVTPLPLWTDKIKERNSLRSEVLILKGIKEEQLKTLGNYGKVSGLWEGVAVLVYACIVGIAIPSTLLPYPPNTYDDTATKHFLLFLLFSELVALFVFLCVSMYKLTKSD